MTAQNLRRQFGLVNEDELAEMLSLKPSTLQVWRVEGLGPKFVKLGKGVFYRDEDIYEWIDRSNTDADNVPPVPDPGV